MLARWHGFTPAEQLRNEMGRLFSRYFDEDGALNRDLGERTFPPLNVWEDGEAFRIEAELPGIELDDLDIAVLGSQVSIKGERKDIKEEGLSYHRRERGTGMFVRTIGLPGEVEAEKVNAKLKDGILELWLPKAQTALPRKIKVKST